MSKITTFTFVSLDGFFAGPHGEIDWFKDIAQDREFNEYTHKKSGSGGAMIFGQTTYEMMKSYWPTADAIKNDPEMAKVLNTGKKIVFSRTIQTVKDEPHWKNVKIISEISREGIIKLKQESSKDFVILGSGTIVQQLSNLNLIDEYTLVMVPVIMGAGKYLFQEVKKINLRLLEAKSFKNGIVLLRYKSK